MLYFIYFCRLETKLNFFVKYNPAENITLPFYPEDQDEERLIYVQKRQ